MANYLWYENVKNSDELQQGDFVVNCPIIIPPKASFKTGETIKVIAQMYNLIILSQSCDLNNNKIKSVLLCPYISLQKLGKNNPFFLTDNGKELLRRGFVHHKHILNKCEIKGFETDYLVVDFKNIYTLNIKVIKELLSERGDRIRLLSPYKEHLSQAFARYFMRVGLPQDIPPFSEEIKILENEENI